MRQNQWDKKLTAYLKQLAREEFVWGKNDCALFVANCLEILTGVDYAKDYRNLYTTEEGAIKALQDIGQGSLKKTFAHLANSKGWKPVKPSFAQRGDMVLFVLEGNHTMGIVHLDGLNIVALGEQGLITRPLEEAQIIWGVR